MKYTVEVAGTSLDSRVLRDLLRRAGCDLIDGDCIGEITSDAISSADSPLAAFNVAKEIRAAFELSEVDPKFALGSVVECKEGKRLKHTVLEAKSIEVRVELGRPILSVTPPRNLPPEEVNQWIVRQKEVDYKRDLNEQAECFLPALVAPKEAATVLGVLKQDKPSAVDLYKAYEVMENDRGGRREFHREYSINRNEFDRFRDAVHNPAVSGNWARHGVDENPRTSNPMTIHEAVNFVKILAKEWLRQKSAQQGGELDAASRRQLP